jgi:predicted ABC-type transport system involved in lysophospholipase L1 biosynthesis ATPase subunit
MLPGDRLVEIRGVSKDYRGLRPLRVARLELRAGQSIALLGFDRLMAEVLVDLVTGATIPDAGEVVVFGQPTTAIPDDQAWLAQLDHLGLLSERAVLVEQFTAEQNLIIPFTLDLEGVSDSLRIRVRQLGDEVGLAGTELAAPVSSLPAAARLRIRLGRALALAPRVLLAEHPNASLSPEDTAAFAADFSRIIGDRRLAALVMTADRTFANAVCEEVLTLQPATGEVTKSSGWRRWF